MDDGLIDIADITGEYDFFDTPFSVSQISILEVEQMPDIRKADFHPFADLDFLHIIAGNKMLHDCHRILCGIKRLKELCRHAYFCGCATALQIPEYAHCPEA